MIIPLLDVLADDAEDEEGVLGFLIPFWFRFTGFLVTLLLRALLLLFLVLLLLLTLELIMFPSECLCPSPLLSTTAAQNKSVRVSV